MGVLTACCHILPVKKNANSTLLPLLQNEKLVALRRQSLQTFDDKAGHITWHGTAPSITGGRSSMEGFYGFTTGFGVVALTSGKLVDKAQKNVDYPRSWQSKLLALK